MTGRLRAWWVDGPRAGTHLFRACAALALVLHAALAFGHSGIRGGGDLVPHLRLIQLVQADPGIYNVYAPFYHWLGALLEPALGLALYTKWFGWWAAVALIAGFRSFQRAAALPDAASALFALTPYLLSLSWCTPKVEAAGTGLLLFGLAALLRGRRVGVALLLAATFAVHTASALLFGLAAGVLCLARRDGGGLLALAAGTLLAAPLVAVHLHAGCSFPEALLFARGGLERSLGESLLPPNWPWLVPLANPLALVAAALGAGAVWQRSRPLATLCLVLAAVYLNNLWLAPFGARTLVTLLRGLSMLAIPVAIAAGVWVGARPAARVWVVAASALWAVVASAWVVPEACFVRRIAAAEIGRVEVQRCAFLWRFGAPDAGRPRAQR